MKQLSIYNKVKTSLRLGRWLLCAALLTLSASRFTLRAQEVIVNPDINYAGTPRTCTIGGLAVEGAIGYEDFMLLGLSGLSVGQEIEVPGPDITKAVKAYWHHGLFSKVAITADSLVGSKIYLKIHLAMLPRVSAINYSGVKVRTWRASSACIRA